VILTINQRKQSTQEIKEHTCIDACTEEYHIPLETPKTKSKGVMDIDGVDAKHGKQFRVD
jgi:hypothetical protein